VLGDWGRGEEKLGEQRARCGEAEVGVVSIGPGRRWGGGEVAGGGGVLLLVSFETVKREEEMGRHHFSGGSEGGMTALWFGSSRVEEGGSWWRMARWHDWRGGGAKGSQRWETTPWWAVPGRKAEWTGYGGSEGETKMGQATKWAESQGGSSINSFFSFLNFKQDFRFKNQWFEILLN
jgi:hypothetical protein